MDRRAVAVLIAVALVALTGCAGLDFGGTEEAKPGGSTPDAAVPTMPAASGTLTPGTGSTITVTVIDVVDGDTIDVRYENGSTDTVRLLGVDTPEVHADNDPAEYEGVPESEAGRTCLRDVGGTATDFAETHLAGETITLVVDPSSDRRGSYGRLLAYVHVDGVDFNYRLLAEGLARVYDSTFERSERYYAAESDAQSEGDGVWTCRSPSGSGDGSGDGGSTPSGSTSLVVDTLRADAPGNDHENPNGEYVVLRNGGNSHLVVGGWTVSDDGGHTYTFPDGFRIDPGESVRLYSGDGENTDEALYWGADGAIWNNGGDVLTVRRDGESVLIHRYD